MTSKQHILKIHPQPLADLLSGAKTCEVRFNDRGFEVGDTVVLREIDPATEAFTGRPDHVRSITHIQQGYGLPDHLCVLSYAQPAAGEPLATWVALTAAGQLRKGDKIRFRFGQETLTETVALVLDAGTEREEIVYNRKRNFYFITSKALAGTSSAKEVEVLRTVAAPPAAAHGDEAVRKPSWKDEHESFKSWARSRITPLKLDLDEVGLFYDEVAGVAHDAWHARAAMRAQGDGEVQ